MTCAATVSTKIDSDSIGSGSGSGGAPLARRHRQPENVFIFNFKKIFNYFFFLEKSVEIIKKNLDPLSSPFSPIYGFFFLIEK